MAGARLLQVVLAASAVASACETRRSESVWLSGTSAPSPADLCDRPPAPDQSPPRVTLIGLQPYCDILAVPVVTLSPSANGAHPDPGSRVVVTSDGRYYTTSRRGHEILEWDERGRFLSRVGGAGSGPGEFDRRGGLKLFVDPHDSLFVLDGGQRWTVYDRDLRLRRSFVGLYGGRINSTVQLARQGILTTATVAIPPADASLAFHLMDFEGNLVRSFGPADGVPNGIDRVERVSALDAQGRIWVAPPNGAATGLMLERWSFDGRRDLTLHRAVEWLPDSGYAAVPHPWEPRLPEYDLLHIDDQGLIWVVVIVRDSRWQLLPASEARQHQTELFDARLEVIDPESGFVLASYRHDGPQDPLPPFARFASGRRSYRLVEDTAGLMSIEIYDIQLVARR